MALVCLVLLEPDRSSLAPLPSATSSTKRKPSKSRPVSLSAWNLSVMLTDAMNAFLIGQFVHLLLQPHNQREHVTKQRGQFSGRHETRTFWLGRSGQGGARLPEGIAHES